MLMEFTIRKDPRKYSDAYKLKKVSYQYALEKGLKVMDSTAFALCQEHNVPIVVFNCNNLNNIENIIKGRKIGTLITK